MIVYGLRKQGKLNELALFAGGGGSILAGKLLGWRTVCAVEIDAGARNILIDRQRDGILEPFPIWDDVRTFDPMPWAGIVDVITAGFPCQDISQCTPNAKGLDGERSGLWFEALRIIRTIRPKFILLENSPMLTSRGLGRVLGGLASMGYDARWGVFRASTIGAAHQRARLYLVAYPNGAELEGLDLSVPPIVDTEKSRRRQFTRAIDAALPAHDYSSMPRDLDVLARGMDGLKATGNGWVPPVAARAFKLLTTMRLEKSQKAGCTGKPWATTTLHSVDLSGIIKETGFH